MEPAEFILKIIIIATICFGILGMIVQSSSFEGIVRGQDNERLSIDLAHAAAAMPCLTEKVTGENRKGLLLAENLDAYQGSRDACISLDKKWSITVTDGSETWRMGQTITGRAHVKTIPVAIKRTNGAVVPGTLTAKLERIE